VSDQCKTKRSFLLVQNVTVNGLLLLSHTQNKKCSTALINKRQLFLGMSSRSWCTRGRSTTAFHLLQRLLKDVTRVPVGFNDTYFLDSTFNGTSVAPTYSADVVPKLKGKGIDGF
jgi:hypothetical protein